MTDDRVCVIGDGCFCDSRRRKRCGNFRMPCPSVRSVYSDHSKTRELREQGMMRQMENMGSTEHRHKIKRATGNFKT